MSAIALIELRATRVAYALLSGGTACACLFAAFTPPIFNTNALLFVLVMAELARSACQIVQYGREA